MNFPEIKRAKPTHLWANDGHGGYEETACYDVGEIKADCLSRAEWAEALAAFVDRYSDDASLYTKRKMRAAITNELRAQAKKDRGE